MDTTGMLLPAMLVALVLIACLFSFGVAPQPARAVVVDDEPTDGPLRRADLWL